MRNRSSKKSPSPRPNGNGDDANGKTSTSNGTNGYTNGHTNGYKTTRSKSPSNGTTAHCVGLGNARAAMDNLGVQQPLLGSDSGSAYPGSSRSGKPRLLTFEESLRLLPWQTDNEYVHYGYRPQMYTIKKCIWSAFAYIHNETVNIHSHSIGALFFAILFPIHVFREKFPSLGAFPDPATLPPSTTIDKICISGYFVAACTCLGLSSWFHTVQCCSRPVCEIAHIGDYVGIIVLIVGSILPGMYYSFDSVTLRVTYMAGIAIAGISAAYIVLSPHHRNHRWDRTLVFIGLGLSAVVPVTHVIFANGLDYARNTMGLGYIVAGGASYIVGAMLYAARFPERVFPGKVDFFGSSHQIFHCFVLLGAWFQFSALRWMAVGRATGLALAKAT